MRYLRKHLAFLLFSNKACFLSALLAVLVSMLQTNPVNSDQSRLIEYNINRELIIPENALIATPNRVTSNLWDLMQFTFEFEDRYFESVEPETTDEPDPDFQLSLSNHWFTAGRFLNWLQYYNQLVTRVQTNTNILSPNRQFAAKFAPQFNEFFSQETLALAQRIPTFTTLLGDNPELTQPPQQFHIQQIAGFLSAGRDDLTLSSNEEVISLIQKLYEEYARYNRVFDFFRFNFLAINAYNETLINNDRPALPVLPSRFIGDEMFAFREAIQHASADIRAHSALRSYRLHRVNQEIRSLRSLRPSASRRRPENADYLCARLCNIL